MKHRILLTSILVVFICGLSKAQTVQELADLAADGLCSCVNETYSDIDNDVKRAMARIIKYQMQGNEEGMENYVAKLPTDLTTRIEAQASIMEENDDLFKCVWMIWRQQWGKLILKKNNTMALQRKNLQK